MRLLVRVLEKGGYEKSKIKNYLIAKYSQIGGKAAINGVRSDADHL
jgi:hypothetical protein